MDPISLGKQIADAGGWAAFVILCTAIGIGVVRAWWVPGWLYRDERARSDRVEAAMTTLTRAVDDALDEQRRDVGGRFMAGRQQRRRDV